jgi:hypothetical protein
VALGDIVEIDERTVLVLGQPLAFDKGQPDVANALLESTTPCSWWTPGSPIPFGRH